MLKSCFTIFYAIVLIKLLLVKCSDKDIKNGILLLKDLLCSIEGSVMLPRREHEAADNDQNNKILLQCIYYIYFIIVDSNGQ